ncbi:unnamed protein product [Moneuplotes crassus]|uniref:Uncharacterized protein n=1 Tax=Euplotes crassus TaxID=5936 RepID=A0AAD2D0G7_EUPCR|nr:unnamed protein product [Moneuplotes crassus]
MFKISLKSCEKSTHSSSRSRLGIFLYIFSRSSSSSWSPFHCFCGTIFCLSFFLPGLLSTECVLPNTTLFLLRGIAYVFCEASSCCFLLLLCCLVLFSLPFLTEFLCGLPAEERSSSILFRSLFFHLIFFI